MISIEHKSYNALATAYDGDYVKLAAARDKYDSWEAAWLAYQSLLGKIDIETEWLKLAKANTRLVLRNDKEFPENLKQIPYPPFALYIKGGLPEQSMPVVAVVGTRKATSNGKVIADKFATELAREGIIIVSGLALGIDTAAHTGALSGGGRTIAVLACGLSKVYPTQNKNLADKILKNNGAIISEYPLESPAYPSRFLERNRIVSGLSAGVLVIEAPERSGALATTRFAVEQNRDVYVVPGPITHENYAGSHKLIRSGAALVTSARDILEELGIEPQKLKLQNFGSESLTTEERTVYATIKLAGVSLHIDKIIELSKLEPYAASRALTFLVVKDIIKECGGGYEINL